MPDCQRCTKRVSESNITRAPLTYDSEAYRLSLCPGCFRDWDHGIWEWLSVADEEPATDPGVGCYYCGQDTVDDCISIGYAQRTWWFHVCPTHSEAWSQFLWRWLTYAELPLKAFAGIGSSRTSGPLPEPPRPTVGDTCCLDEDDLHNEQHELANHVALQLRDLDLAWADVLAVLDQPVAIAHTDVEGVRRYMSPTLTVFVDEPRRLVVGVRRESGYRGQRFSHLARSYTYSQHARERMALRAIQPEDVMRVIDDRAKTIRPSPDYDDALVYQSVDLGVVLDPVRQQIVTVFWRSCPMEAAS